MIIFSFYLFTQFSPTITGNQVLSIEELPIDSEIHRVDITEFEYSPKTLSINLGDTVIWTNKDPVRHTVTSNEVNLDSDLLSEGKTYIYTFKVFGTYNYHCTPHPYMEGKVIVK
ncbi:cupredoxin family copper-binding protein [archaeon]|nr:cupredoxin family copper-binding protein [archaeon]